jgi:exodeoxyribonuclease V gamma subunit
MLYLYQSNRLEQLGAMFTSVAQAVPLSDPFQAEVVMVQSRGMGRWLSLAAARTSGIAANFDFVLPAAYAWRLMRQALPGLPEQSAFAPDILAWRLMGLLPTLDDPVFAPLQHYQAAGERAVFELAGRVADIFDQYLVFRPDWIRSWEAGQLLGLGEDEPWQAALWQRLVALIPGLHRVGMNDAFLPALCADMLPERITLFGISSLAPMYLALIRRLSELTDVCVFLLNPCEEYWGNIIDARGQLQLSGQGLDVEPDHPLLASLGKQGRDFFDLVSESALYPDPMFKPAQGTSLLARLQNDVLTLSMPQPADLLPDDASIEIHATHGAMRELEVLKDRLLAMFAADASLTPADVAVLTPDINSYAPYIDAVFGARTDAPTIPYSIADRRLEREVPLLATFSALLDLIDSRFQADAVLALLDCPALLRRFGLSAPDVPLLQDWVRAAAIRWGRDAGHKQQLGLLADATFTWRWGLDRLLLGAVLPKAMAGHASPLFEGLLPLSLATGAQLELLTRLCAFYQQLEQLACLWQAPATLQEWGARLQAALQALFEPDEEEDLSLALLREAIDALLREAGAAEFAQPVALPVIRDALSRRLSQSSPGGFLAGGVTFCAMVPMRSIPFRVLCLIGMNDGAYPRDERPVSFDLVAQHPRKGDRSRRFDDRYLFLEALLSARETLYLSYVGLSARSNEALPPSPLVAELLDTLRAMGADVQRLSVSHPLQPFSPACYDGQDARLASFEPSYAAALALPRQAPQPFAAALGLPEIGCELHLDDFLWFWRLPCRAWLSGQLGIRLHTAEDALPVREPFCLDRDGQQAVLNQVVDARLNDRSLHTVADSLRGAGVLPPALLGEACMAGPLQQGRRFAAGLPDVLKQPPLPPIPLRLELEGVTLLGALPGMRPAGRMSYVVRPAFSTELIECWLLHLLLCVCQPPGVEPVTELYAQNGVQRLAWQADARTLLRPWLAFWRQGQGFPLAFFARTSLAYARSLLDTPDDRPGAMQKARDEWEPLFDGKFPQKDEPAIELAFRYIDPLQDPQFAHLAEILLLPMLQALAAGQEPV